MFCTTELLKAIRAVHSGQTPAGGGGGLAGGAIAARPDLSAREVRCCN
jgi:hypothetical protein